MRSVRELLLLVILAYFVAIAIIVVKDMQILKELASESQTTEYETCGQQGCPPYDYIDPRNLK